jgi:hypothetical protein
VSFAVEKTLSPRAVFWALVDETPQKQTNDKNMNPNIDSLPDRRFFAPPVFASRKWDGAGVATGTLKPPPVEGPTSRRTFFRSPTMS